MKVYDNRELSWLKFNKRVLEEAKANENPLMERMLFQSIFSSNLDEFFMVRVGSLYDSSLVNDEEKDNKSNMRPSEQLKAIYKRVHQLNDIKDSSFEKLSDELEGRNIFHKKIKDLSKPELDFLQAYYSYEIKPFLNAVIIDKRHPFPFLVNKSIYVISKLSSKQGISYGIIGCSEKWGRVVFLPSEDDNSVSYILVEDVISHYAHEAFEGYNIEEKALMRITRNADIDVEESFDSELDFRQSMSVLINKRKRLCPIRLQLSQNISDMTLDELCSRLEISHKQVFIESSPLDFSYVFSVFEKVRDKKDLFFDPLEPQPSVMIDDNIPMINQIDDHDLFLSYPYESIKPFIRLLNEAAKDESVVSIKMTLYRVAKNSKIIKALCTAAENGKNVLVLVELRARFDEENNIEWSKQLEEAGCNVMYGPKGLKVHSKLCLITRKVGMNVKYTVQIGTGNYNEKTSELYTDLSLMTSDETIAKDAEEVFKTLSLGELVEDTSALLVAPHCLQNKILKMMDDEINIAKSGGIGYVGAKLNSLTDKLIIDKIIECSQAGVKVQLVIRGISCLIAGVPGVTENVEIRSIVGRYLEHARIYIFGSGSRRKVYISSADYMTRNTTRRVEVAAPIKDENIKNRVLDYFKSEMNDNVKAREMLPDGNYEHVKAEGPLLDSQKHFYAESYANAKQKKEKETTVSMTAESVATFAPINNTPVTPSPEVPPVQTEQPIQQEIPIEQPPKKQGFFARIIAFFKRKK